MAKMYQGQPSLEYWEATQKVLQGDTPIVRRPRLTEALLKKPPFRFLHDIVTEVCRQTGFAGGLFSPEEQTSSNIKDKDSKVAYLVKIINCVGITLNAHVPARPLKIVSGMEPEQTNVFLQMLAVATTVDSPVRQRAVSRVLLGEKMNSLEQGTMDWAHRYFLLSGCLLPSMKEGGAASTHRNAEETIAASLLGIPSQHLTPANESLDSKTGRDEMDRKHLLKPHHVGDPAFISSTQQSSTVISSGAVIPAGVSRRADEKFVDEEAVEPLITVNTTEEAWPSPVQSLSDANIRNCGTPLQHMVDALPSTSRTETLSSAARPMTEGGDGRANFNAWTARLDTLGGFPSFAARPQSARKGPPKIHSGVVTAAKVPLKKSAAAQPDMHSSLLGGVEKAISNVRHPSILLYRESEEEDESDSLPVLIPDQQHLPSESVDASLGSVKVPQSILGLSEDEERPVGRVDNDSVGEQDILLGAIEVTDEDAQTREEVQKLQVMVQSLCQAANPLGKAVDYLQEDEETMNKEHRFWIKERDVYSVRLDEEKRITDEILQAEAGRILELDEEVHDHQHKITSAKAQILRNDDTIMTLLRMVTTRQLK